ncbi:MAG: DUF1573 domain-containing protein [Flavobacterium sp.]|nr:DUF1573 domain-containing protein [Flavobacterium sp.]
MKKIISFLSFLLFISCSERKPIIKILNPKINIKAEKSKNLINFYINIENTGNDDLIIENVNTSCKCLASFEKKIIIKPNSKDSLKINYLNDEKINISEQIVIVSNTEPKINFVDINFKNK